jgi:hypothetical protein
VKVSGETFPPCEELKPQHKIELIAPLIINWVDEGN